MELYNELGLWSVICYMKMSQLVLRDENRGWRTKCHTIDCARNTVLFLQKHLTSCTELILIAWKIFPNEEHVQCDQRRLEKARKCSSAQGPHSEVVPRAF